MNSKKIKNWDRTQTWIPEKIYEPKKFEALISDYEGRPHWGKRFLGNHEEIRKLYSGPEYQNLDIYQVNCTYYSALECNDDAYIAARTIQFFAPGLPQVYYVGLLAGENDIELVERTKNGRDINRHNYSLDEIKVEIQKPVVQRLLRLMEFRNSYPAFDGQFVIAEAPDDQLKLSWSQTPYHTTASIDLRSYSVQIEYYDKDQRKTKIFSA